MTKAVLFGTSTCPRCSRAKRYLKDKGVPVKEINVERDGRAARDVVKKTGQMGVPVVKIGPEWIVGFDRQRIDRALAARRS